MNFKNHSSRHYLFFLLASSLSLQSAASASASVPVDVYSTIPAVDCVINPFRVVDISSPVVGVIEKLYVERSEKVAAGQVVAQLEARVEHANVALARYRASLQSEIGLGQVNINFDQLRKKRVESLLARQNISVENADQIEREVQLSKWKLKQARELADIRKLELRRAEEQLLQKSIRAPFDGYVLDTFKYRGEYVESQAILRLAQLDPLVIEAIVPMENFGMVRTGMRAEIRAEVLFKDKLMGRVMAVDRIGDTASNTFGVKMSMPNPENLIPAGLKCVVKFIETPDPQVAQLEHLQARPDTGEDAILKPRDDTGGDSLEPAPGKEMNGAASKPEDGEQGSIQASLTNAAEITALAQTQSAQQLVNAMQQDESLNTRQLRKTHVSYMVLIEQGQTDGQTRALIEQLQQAGVHDLQEFDHGANKGLISLGVYNNRAPAIRRQQMLDKYGFATFMVERY